MKPKKCKACGKEFVPMRSTAIACSYPCAKAWVDLRSEKLAKQREAQVKKIDRQITKERKEALKTVRDWIKEAQIAFNAWIRFRDRNQPCICCGEPLGDAKYGGGYDAGHYRSTGSAKHLRFNEDNCHAQRKYCNQYGSGRAVDYRIGLIKRIGQERVDALESNNEIHKWTIDEVKAIKEYYKNKLKEGKISL